MTDCKREDICASAKRRKAMNGFSGSIVGEAVWAEDEVWLEPEGDSGEAAITHDTVRIDMARIFRIDR